MMAATPEDTRMQYMTPMVMLIEQQQGKTDYAIVYAQTPQVWVALNTSTATKVIVIVLPMILMLRLNLKYPPFRAIMMLRDTLIGR